jgi:hypothetical protein
MILFQNCQRPLAKLSKGATIKEEHLINCFQEGVQLGGREVWCEASAIFYDGRNLYLANDKDMPGADASVFYIPYAEKDLINEKPIYFSQPQLKSSHKFEDFALTPSQKYVFLTTGFDRIKEGSDEWDGYNSLLYWPVSKSVQSINPKIAKLKPEEKYSLSLRMALSKTLRSEEFPNGMPYFKIEGLAATDDKLYFGIREEGKKFDDFKYKVKVLTVSYHFVADTLVMSDNFQTLADINLTNLDPTLPQNLALASIEYDSKRKVFWILTSVEDPNQHNSAYLWWASESDLKAGKMNIINDKISKQPLKFDHKAEDLAFISKNRIFIIHDDDRNKTKVDNKTRQPNQAAYSIVELD